MKALTNQPVQKVIMAKEILRVSGIYAIRNVNNGKCYIGSSINVLGRWKTHRTQLRAGIHHSRLLQRAWSAHGESSFLFEVVEAASCAELMKREQHWMDAVQAYGETGYNSRPLAQSSRGFKQRAESIASRVEKLRGRKLSPERVAAMSARMLGKRLPPVSQDGKRRQIEALKVRVISDETRLKMSTSAKASYTEAMRASFIARNKERAGKALSKDHRAKVSAANIGSKNSFAKLTEDAVREIRKRCGQDMTQADAARKYGVTIQAVNIAFHRKSWTHVI